MVSMNSLSKDQSAFNPFYFETINDLIEACVNYYHDCLVKGEEKSSEVFERRAQLSRWIRKFHQECGTLNPCVETTLEKLENDQCIFLMTAHQPNLFAYSGVFRKATLNYVLAEKLSKILKVPVVTFFGIADQDFSD
ncbi:MAG: bacillithiol biosynthesis BshC, partial [Candidatus Bathyarchaeia archaeon]